jgi:hypothetical protein
MVLPHGEKPFRAVQWMSVCIGGPRGAGGDDRLMSAKLL